MEETYGAFVVTPTRGKLLNNIKKVIKKKLGKEVISSIGIGFRGKKIKAYKIIIKNGDPLRLDIKKHTDEITRLQIIANKTDIEIPKVVFVHGHYKCSEWIEGIMLHQVWNIAEVFVKTGDLVARLNLIKDPLTKEFLVNGEVSSTNAIWTPDKKVYIIDQGRMRTNSNPDKSVVMILLKRIREKERINLFLKTYSKYRDIDNIMKMIEKRNWKWEAPTKTYSLKKSTYDLQY